ncbi:hypothetical protein [Mycolicibacterium diernhoferi]|uniref:Uncharacterized protein n=1 Tax=Mycolicibacterium diernhoferi TaxID=1801 RepID=A0A1Q4HIX4_9MYCO|nr:hypothetical protein [Mycolicibacterium diernhoferi]OJZ67435.1 hypothetical protein BRW64_03890 [Mycolicibacterium diernhoferi]OPE56024.1 hypothetical protein BV510_01905 [Mycolicibacterium diernhoferi]PEG54963.1 hypothetical protein CRI78_09020 [Mycolicibacterium diernhoferi]QYL25079.1 hypothetical protein K0O62_13015 [Mycolicibacterium diernhoferi]
MSVLVRVGLFELAFGALLGWAMVGNLAAPQLMERLGIVSPRRILQAHLDYVMMGLILIAVGLALPGLATWIAVLVIVGTLLNPTLFLPLAFNEKLAKTLAFQGVSFVSFLAVSVGLVAAACSAL